MPAAAVAMFSGIVAAGLGLGALAVLVLLLWTTSPYPDSGAGGALHVAADLWLLAHGAHLVRTEALTGLPAPVALTPLLLPLLPAWLLHRGCAQALHERERARRRAHRSAHRAGREPLEAGVSACVASVAAGYLLTGAVTVLYAAQGPVRVDVPSAALWLPLFAAVVAVAARSGAVPAEPAPHAGAAARGAAAGSAADDPGIGLAVPTVSFTPARLGRHRPPGPVLGTLAVEFRLPPLLAAPGAGGVPLTLAVRMPRFCEAAGATATPPVAGSDPVAGPAPLAGPGAVRAADRAADQAADPGGRLGPLRAALTGAAALCCGGLLLTLGSAVWHATAVQASFLHLTEAWSGRFAVLLLALALLPNAAVWGAAYGLGPGFTLGEGHTVGPLSAGGDLPLPPFPLLEALPGGGHAGPGSWVLAASVPVAAGLALGRCVARAAVPERGSRQGAAGWRPTLYAAVLAACGCGAATALLAACAGGALGTEALARFGPNWWLTGAAALAWTGLVGAPGALAVRAWRLARPARGTAAQAGPVEDTFVAAWHETGARRARWAAIKVASGGLMPDFDPRED